MNPLGPDEGINEIEHPDCRACKERERINLGLITENRQLKDRLAKGGDASARNDDASQRNDRSTVVAGAGVEDGSGPSDECEHCKGTGHDWEPGPTGEPISLGPCPDCEGTGTRPLPAEQSKLEELLQWAQEGKDSAYESSQNVRPETEGSYYLGGVQAAYQQFVTKLRSELGADQ